MIRFVLTMACGLLLGAGAIYGALWLRLLSVAPLSAEQQPLPATPLETAAPIPTLPPAVAPTSPPGATLVSSPAPATRGTGDDRLLTELYERGRAVDRLHSGPNAVRMLLLDRPHHPAYLPPALQRRRARRRLAPVWHR